MRVVASTKRWCAHHHHPGGCSHQNRDGRTVVPETVEKQHLSCRAQIRLPSTRWPTTNRGAGSGSASLTRKGSTSCLSPPAPRSTAPCSGRSSRYGPAAGPITAGPDRRSPTTRPVVLIAAVTLAVGLGSIASTGAAVAAEPSVVMTNLPPIGQPDFYNTIENGTLTITAPGVLANDTDPNGDGITVAYLQTAPTHGMVSGPNIIGHFDYTPTKGFVGIDTFKYVITDGSLISAPITVSVHVIALKPLAHNDSYVTDRNRTLDVPAPGLMRNDVDPNGYLLSMGDDRAEAETRLCAADLEGPVPVRPEPGVLRNGHLHLHGDQQQPDLAAGDGEDHRHCERETQGV